jgi:hypothetical protein
VVDLFFKRELGLGHGLPLDRSREIVAAVALILLEYGVVFSK